jgi:hypothetical protein
MTRRSKAGSGRAKKKGGGLIMGMRSGVKNIAGTGGGSAPRRNRFWNVVTVLLVLVTAVVLLRRFGVISF